MRTRIGAADLKVRATAARMRTRIGAADLKVCPTAARMRTRIVGAELKVRAMAAPRANQHREGKSEGLRYGCSTSHARR
jgi:hypothetical protein